MNSFAMTVVQELEIVRATTGLGSDARILEDRHLGAFSLLRGGARNQVAPLVDLPRRKTRIPIESMLMGVDEDSMNALNEATAFVQKGGPIGGELA